jgi:hypothetical protein
MDKIPFEELYLAMNQAWDELKWLRRQLRANPATIEFKNEEQKLVEWLEEAEKEYSIRLKRLKTD